MANGRKREMANGRLAGKRVLLTNADAYMGEATVQVFEEEGAEVIADHTDLTKVGAAEEVVERAGHIDVLVANFAVDAHFGVTVLETDEELWQTAYETIVHPLHRICRAVLPQFYERNKGKIVVYGSAAAMRYQEGALAYSTARFAQRGYVTALGPEAARHNVNVNFIAQHWTQNKEYFWPERIATDEFKEDMARRVPLGRLATAREDALLALFLASDESDFIVGKSIEFDGGWAT
uniref:Halohydrin epoxidase B n=1 Tax=Corynebacterium sp. TaxID=1720 RepID=A0ACD6B934_CORSP|nr:halohydrin epoxidase B [Corynebacterium sp.]prf//2018169B halohydrin hydrogen-halide-lyase [Corynebacterium sp.]